MLSWAELRGAKAVKQAPGTAVPRSISLERGQSPSVMKALGLTAHPATFAAGKAQEKYSSYLEILELSNRDVSSLGSRKNIESLDRV